MKINLMQQFKYRVQDGDNETKIYQKFNTDKEHVLRNNPNIPLYVGEWIEINVNNFKTHTVKPMENLTTISKIYGVETQKLAIDNNLKSEKLFIGQQIKIFK